MAKNLSECNIVYGHIWLISLITAILHLHSPCRSDRLWGPLNLLSIWYRELFPPGLKRPGREADHSPQLVPRSRKCGSIHPLSHTPSWRSVYLVTYRDNLTFTCIYNLAIIGTSSIKHFQEEFQSATLRYMKLVQCSSKPQMHTISESSIVFKHPVALLFCTH
jgi:hypothetical protein